MAMSVNGVSTTKKRQFQCENFIRVLCAGIGINGIIGMIPDNYTVGLQKQKRLRLITLKNTAMKVRRRSEMAKEQAKAAKLTAIETLKNTTINKLIELWNEIEKKTLTSRRFPV